MRKLENAKLIIDELAMLLDNNLTDLTGLLMIFDAIARKITDEDTHKDIKVGDYFN